MTKIRLATTAQVADVVRLTAVAGVAVPANDAVPATFTLSNTRFASIATDDPTRLVLSSGFYARGNSPIAAGVYLTFDIIGGGTLYRPGAPADRVQVRVGIDGSEPGVSTGAEYVDLFLLIPLGGVSHLPIAED